MTDEVRCAILESRATKLNELWWAADLGSAEERRIDLALTDIEKELEAIYRRRDAAWGAADTRILRDIGDGYNASEL